MDVNVKGVFLSCKAELPAMLEGGFGRIVNISPLRGDMPADVDAEWIPILPGTDTAISSAAPAARPRPPRRPRGVW